MLTQENQYNGNGQRIQKKETKGQKTKANNYYYQNGTLLYTTDESGKRTSLNLMGIDGNLIATARNLEGDENWYLYNKDVRGSTSSLIASSGAVAATYEYDAFGNTDIWVDEGFDNEICYNGQLFDQNTGLYYYNARFYDPEGGRFVSQDTYRGEQDKPETLHLYTYCANNPINFVDPSGHFATAVALTAGVSISVSAVVGALVVTAAIVAIGIVLYKHRYNKNRKYSVRIRVDRPDRYSHKTGVQAMKARWKDMRKRSTRYKLGQFANHHRWRYHLHVEICKYGRPIRKLTI